MIVANQSAQLSQQADPESYTLIMPNGLSYIYQSSPSAPGVHRIQFIQDRFGNQLMFAYDDSSPDSPFLSTITINTDGSNNIASGQQRVITFYPDELRRIDHITDYYQAAGSGGTPKQAGAPGTIIMTAMATWWT